MICLADSEGVVEGVINDSRGRCFLPGKAHVSTTER